MHNIVKYPQCRQHALMIIQQLVLSPSGEDDMGTLLGLMHSAPPTELQLKTDILRVNKVLLHRMLASISHCCTKENIKQGTGFSGWYLATECRLSLELKCLHLMCSFYCLPSVYGRFQDQR